ncbi:butanol dehydrogenase [Fistulifera solaris]|uniref:Butanol dehydrogenase n=1 Tax=Fistulifera solaris TaxID=1519565 RepID=A0A1Z5JFD1_FISSO|nr:butanol dehydrogenase [Fistulifera solaris]|eukprot:GAX12636.1 butanol dehydrogenase [Fistulifera solaris]
MTFGNKAAPRRSAAMIPHENKNDYSMHFRETSSADAQSLVDGVRLITPAKEKNSAVILPWIGYGTYRLGEKQALDATLEAIRCGYRSIDTAFIYGGEKTEVLVGQAVRKAIDEKVIHSREEIFVTTKHWRKYHGYDASLQCLKLSLKRLDMEYVDLWLMHWPGPAYNTMNKKKEDVEKDPFFYATTAPEDMADLRAETWRAMEDAYRQGLCRSIGVSNMSIKQLRKLKESAKIWPPAVNQVEVHPLHPQDELLEYCRQEGVIVQAYASLGGQDTGKQLFAQLLGEKATKKQKCSLLDASLVTELASQLKATPAQTLLRWGLQRNCVQIPKTTSKSRMLENAAALSISMTDEQVERLKEELRSNVIRNNPDAEVNEITRLCWRRDPLRHLDFD